MTMQGEKRVTRQRFPGTDRAVVGSRHKPHPRLVKGNGPDPVSMPRQRQHRIWAGGFNTPGGSHGGTAFLNRLGFHVRGNGEAEQ